MERFFEKQKANLIKHPIIWPLLVSIIIDMVLVSFWFISKFSNPFEYGFDILFLLLLVLLAGMCCIYPPVLTLLNIYFLFKRQLGKNSLRVGHIVEYTTIIVGVFFSYLYQEYSFDNLSSVIFSADYYETLYAYQKHTPIFTQAWPTLITIMCVALIGYLILRVVPLAKQPPLVTVLSMSAVYMLTVLCVVFIIQIFGAENMAPFVLFASALIIIALKVIREITAEWKKVHPADDETQFGGKKLPIMLNKILCKACVLPIVAFVLALPLLGVIIGILVLTGQSPDAIIQAWTQTADWNLSQQIAPPNEQYPGHYLCTVAAGGHKKVVKPLRNGKRHGRDVIVNRQLCVANAFEQLLEERVPRFHKFIRGIYDKYGYPISRHIKTKTAADAVYFIMKPLEWVFLAVLYLCDTHPENRIAVQYPHAPLPDSIRMR